MLSNIIKQNTNEGQELRGLFENGLRELYWTENVMLPMMGHCIILAFSRDLTALLESKRIVAIKHVQRLEAIFGLVGIPRKQKKSDNMQCLIDEAEKLENQIPRGVVRDAALIAILQKIKHNEIACYGTLRAFALALHEEDVVTLLEDTLNEEKQSDMALTAIAEAHINIEAADKEI